MDYLWVGEWYSHNRLNGTIRFILYENCLPALFRTRKACREYIHQHYGYIKVRKDLRKEPYGWRLPRAAKVVIKVV